MNSFELFLLLMLCASFVVGPWLGYRDGHRDGAKAGADIIRKAAFGDGFSKGYAEGAADMYDYGPAGTLPLKVTQAMPIVPVTVNGDEVDLSPKRAADVRRPE